ncbi:hypothetical protein WHR41_04433 [Cladosporium halotolerans]|uniref:LEA domain protein n=1 Tax=Cladosporium halotolerans TaxID=1052096 RepID=A0AB34KQ79_9PEZI
MFRTTLARNARLFSTAPALRKSATDAAKESGKQADQTLSGAAVKGLDKAQELAQKAKEAAGFGSAEAQGKASEVAGQASGKAEELKGQAKGTASQVEGKAKGAYEEAKGKMGK